MKLTLVGFAEGKRCDNCSKDADAFHVRCDAGTLDADLCVKCLTRQCRMRVKAMQANVAGRQTEGSGS